MPECPFSASDDPITALYLAAEALCLLGDALDEKDGGLACLLCLLSANIKESAQKLDNAGH